jgi:hypothetical protein
MGHQVGPHVSCARRGMCKTMRWLQALILPSRRIISSNNRLFVYSASAAASAITSSHPLASAHRPPPQAMGR